MDAHKIDSRYVTMLWQLKKPIVTRAMNGNLIYRKRISDRLTDEERNAMKVKGLIGST